MIRDYPIRCHSYRNLANKQDFEKFYSPTPVSPFDGTMQRQRALLRICRHQVIGQWSTQIMRALHDASSFRDAREVLPFFTAHPTDDSTFFSYSSVVDCLHQRSLRVPQFKTGCMRNGPRRWRILCWRTDQPLGMNVTPGFEI